MKDLFYIDTHSHIYFKNFNKDRFNLINEMNNDNLLSMFIIGIDLETSIESVKLANENENCYSTVGYHPHEVKHLNEDILNEIEKLAKSNEKCIAIGEIGLDFYRNFSDRDDQFKYFEMQIELAKKLDLPIIIHNRNANNDIYPILLKNKGKIRGLFHHFSGDLDYAKNILDLGFYISFSGVLTYNSAKEMREIAKFAPNNRIMAETDCPFLTPEPFRGKRNQPAYVKYVYERLSMIKDIPITDLCYLIKENVNELFRIKL